MEPLESHQNVFVGSSSQINQSHKSTEINQLNEIKSRTGVMIRGDLQLDTRSTRHVLSQRTLKLQDGCILRISKTHINTSIAIFPIPLSANHSELYNLVNLRYFGDYARVKTLEKEETKGFFTLYVQYELRFSAQHAKDRLINLNYSGVILNVMWADSEFLNNSIFVYFETPIPNSSLQSFSEEAVIEAFAQKFGPVIRADLQVDRLGNFKGCGIIFFVNSGKGERAATRALQLEEQERKVNVCGVCVKYKPRYENKSQKMKKRNYFWTVHEVKVKPTKVEKSEQDKEQQKKKKKEKRKEKMREKKKEKKLLKADKEIHYNSHHI
ncbi:MAG: hypothetical protein EZS28_000583 [Streblomastix strix]|uniref:RRM domain-containing protein n=1 Tax=Streblomastix strix TaxID=222440 RepID=A0A5J4XAR9_9EUKA|nr:MAG: hypothetical protein EZS28_000583 [Streblomastix strix]